MGAESSEIQTIDPSESFDPTLTAKTGIQVTPIAGTDINTIKEATADTSMQMQPIAVYPKPYKNILNSPLVDSGFQTYKEEAVTPQDHLAAIADQEAAAVIDENLDVIAKAIDDLSFEEQSKVIQDIAAETKSLNEKDKTSIFAAVKAEIRSIKEGVQNQVSKIKANALNVYQSEELKDKVLYGIKTAANVVGLVSNIAMLPINQLAKGSGWLSANVFEKTLLNFNEILGRNIGIDAAKILRATKLRMAAIKFEEAIFGQSYGEKYIKELIAVFQDESAIAQYLQDPSSVEISPNAHAIIQSLINKEDVATKEFFDLLNNIGFVTNPPANSNELIDTFIRLAKANYGQDRELVGYQLEELFGGANAKSAKEAAAAGARLGFTISLGSKIFGELTGALSNYFPGLKGVDPQRAGQLLYGYLKSGGNISNQVDWISDGLIKNSEKIKVEHALGALGLAGFIDYITHQISSSNTLYLAIDTAFLSTLSDKGKEVIGSFKDNAFGKIMELYSRMSLIETAATSVAGYASQAANAYRPAAQTQEIQEALRIAESLRPVTNNDPIDTNFIRHNEGYVAKVNVEGTEVIALMEKGNLSVLDPETGQKIPVLQLEKNEKGFEMLQTVADNPAITRLSTEDSTKEVKTLDKELKSQLFTNLDLATKDKESKSIESDDSPEASQPLAEKASAMARIAPELDSAQQETQTETIDRSEIDMGTIKRGDTVIGNIREYIDAQSPERYQAIVNGTIERYHSYEPDAQSYLFERLTVRGLMSSDQANALIYGRGDIESLKELLRENPSTLVILQSDLNRYEEDHDSDNEVFGSIDYVPKIFLATTHVQQTPAESEPAEAAEQQPQTNPDQGRNLEPRDTSQEPPINRPAEESRPQEPTTPQLSTQERVDLIESAARSNAPISSQELYAIINTDEARELNPLAYTGEGTIYKVNVDGIDHYYYIDTAMAVPISTDTNNFVRMQDGSAYVYYNSVINDGFDGIYRLGPEDNPVVTHFAPAEFGQLEAEGIRVNMDDPDNITLERVVETQPTNTTPEVTPEVTERATETPTIIPSETAVPTAIPTEVRPTVEPTVIAPTATREAPTEIPTRATEEVTPEQTIEPIPERIDPNALLNSRDLPDMQNEQVTVFWRGDGGSSRNFTRIELNGETGIYDNYGNLITRAPLTDTNGNVFVYYNGSDSHPAGVYRLAVDPTQRTEGELTFLDTEAELLANHVRVIGDGPAIQLITETTTQVASTIQPTPTFTPSTTPEPTERPTEVAPTATRTLLPTETQTPVPTASQTLTPEQTMAERLLQDNVLSRAERQELSASNQLITYTGEGGLIYAIDIAQNNNTERYYFDGLGTMIGRDTSGNAIRLEDGTAFVIYSHEGFNDVIRLNNDDTLNILREDSQRLDDWGVRLRSTGDESQLVLIDDIILDAGGRYEVNGQERYRNWERVLDIVRNQVTNQPGNREIMNFLDSVQQDGINENEALALNDMLVNRLPQDYLSERGVINVEKVADNLLVRNTLQENAIILAIVEAGALAATTGYKIAKKNLARRKSIPIITPHAKVISEKGYAKFGKSLTKIEELLKPKDE